MKINSGAHANDLALALIPYINIHCISLGSKDTLLDLELTADINTHA